MDLSILFQIRDGLLAVLPGGRDASLIYLGILLAILASAVARRPLRRPSVLIPGAVVFIAFAVLAVVQAGNTGDPVAWGRLALDFLHLLLAPTVLMLTARWGWLRT